ncbi:MAG: cytochrome c oxidase assembly protein [Alphaproteobacteria bacterium]|jgi:cytochrome c oxidase assembly protein subunit 11|nr:cytochrome c oxidase assembly protein [Alphaproteobacteria bacterium]HJO97811.1 cytochrome c oxidase assembly protein [Rhodospirillales bacterium]
MAKPRHNNGATAAVLFSVAAGMVGLAFASAPLYRLFCEVTGYGGTPQTGATATSGGVASQRLVTVRFDASVNSKLPWKFTPERRQITVRVGEEALVYYRAINLSSEPMTGTATFNVTPYKAASYFGKVDCFCFTEQTLKPGEEAAMAVSFFVDPEIFEDPNTRDVSTISLSYTFFRAKQETAARTRSPDKG